MVSFAELKAKAEKAKDASVTAVTNTRDRYSSTPSSKVNWDPNWKRGTPTAPSASASRVSQSLPPPPPPQRSRPDAVAAPVPPRRPLHGGTPYAPPPPPTRVASGYPSQPSQDATSIDWAHLSAEDKAAFFGWLDEFFSRYLGIEVGPGAGRAIPLGSSVVRETVRPPSVNKTTRPHV